MSNLIEIVTVFLQHKGRVLILKRSETESFPGLWGAVSGSLEQGETDPLDAALREIREETGLSGDDITLVKRGELYVIPDPERNRGFVSYPFLFKVAKGAVKKIRLNEEHTEKKWVEPDRLEEYETVLDLYKAVEKCFSVEMFRQKKSKS